MAKKKSDNTTPEDKKASLSSAGGLKAALPGVQDEATRKARNVRSDREKKAPAPKSVTSGAPSAPSPTLGKSAPTEEPVVSKKPGEHRLNPNKNAKLIPMQNLREETQEATSEWRDGMERNDIEVEPEEVQQGKFRRLVLVGVLLILVLGGWIAKSAIQKYNDSQLPSRAPALVAFDAEQQLVSDATEVLRNYLATEDITEKFKYTRDTEDRIRDMERYLGDRPEEQGIQIIGETLAIQQFERQGTPFLGLVFEFDDVSRRGVVFEITDDGPKLDWRSFVGYSDMSVDEFLRVQPLEPMLMRVVLSEDDYYNFKYSDPKKWVCVKVENASRDRSFWAYCRRNSATHLALVTGEKELAAKRIGIFEAVVQVRFEEEGRDRKQALLEEFVAAGHLVK